MIEQEYLENEILSKEFVEDYNLEECMVISKLLMKKFNRLRNACPEELELRITPNYEPVYSCPLPRKNNQMDKIDNHIDDVNDYAFMNEKIKNIMKKMNNEEKACFTELLLHNKAEYAVAKIMGRSRNGMIPFVNSCVVRLVLAFHMEIKKGQMSDIDVNKEIELKYY